MKRVLATLLVVTISAPGQASADTKTTSAVDACIQASEDTQRERASGHLRAARARSAECLDARCPTAIRRDCDAQATEIARLVPTVVFRVRDSGGADIPAARITIDGVADPAALDGRAHELDPGTHEISASADGYAVSQSRIVVEEGVRARVIELRPERLTAKRTTASSDVIAPPPPAGTERAPVTWISSGALAGVSVIGLGLFAGFGLSADADFRHLRDTCGTACDPRDADSVHRRYQIADVALGVGLVALASAVVVFLVGPRQR